MMHLEGFAHLYGCTLLTLDTLGECAAEQLYRLSVTLSLAKSLDTLAYPTVPWQIHQFSTKQLNF